MLKLSTISSSVLGGWTNSRSLSITSSPACFHRDMRFVISSFSAWCRLSTANWFRFFSTNALRDSVSRFSYSSLSSFEDSRKFLAANSNFFLLMTVRFDAHWDLSNVDKFGVVALGRDIGRLVAVFDTFPADDVPAVGVIWNSKQTIRECSSEWTDSLQYSMIFWWSLQFCLIPNDAPVFWLAYSLRFLKNWKVHRL